MEKALIIDAVRTPRARRKGKFSAIHAVDLLTYPLNALKERNNLATEQVQDVVIGCVTQTQEQGWCVGRASVLAAGWPISVPSTTINRLCGSGQQATNFAAMGIQSGNYELAVSGGVEHMTRVPMFSDCGGEESPLLKKHHPDLVQQGMAAEILSTEYKLTRAQIDEFAYNSQMKAKKAREEGRFKKGLISVPYLDENKQEARLDFDDNIRAETTIEGLSSLKPAFKEHGVITAGNASAIVDGAAALLLANEKKAVELKLKPRARIIAMSAVGSPPRIMLTGPIAASHKALQQAGLKISDIDLWEINEAFAPVPLVTLQELGIDPQKVNVNGGGIALGHPLGATGAMLIGTALDELERSNKRYALITMCIGLGMGISTIIERI
ncbi:MAG: thiolase family protein [Deltaproteobacteria bacterium]|nr:thiolase family protein [Deltaproteobacteria bacterium]